MPSASSRRRSGGRSRRGSPSCHQAHAGDEHRPVERRARRAGPEVRVRQRPRLLDQRPQRVHRRLRDLVDRLLDRRQRRVRPGRRLDPVEADDGQVVGDADAHALGAVCSTPIAIRSLEQMTPVGGRGRRRSVVAARAPPSTSNSSCAIRRRRRDRSRGRRASRADRCLLPRRQVVLGPGDEADPRVPELDQVLRGELRRPRARPRRRTGTSSRFSAPFTNTIRAPSPTSVA